MQKKHNTIKVKVIGWFLLAALAVLLTGIISYNSYRDLLRSLENTSVQETKLKALGEILVDITHAEAKMRAYALTKESTQLQEYQQLVTGIRQTLEQVKSMEPVDLSFNTQVDSISLLLNNQTAGIQGFIELKKTLNELSFSSLALEEISGSTDSVPALRTTTTTTTTTTKVDPVLPEDEEAGKNTRRQQKKRAQEIAKELLKLDKEPQIETETIVTTDTSFVQPDTVMENIQQILVDLSHEESRYQQVLANKELKLVESNIQIITQIRSLIGSLEKQELAVNVQKANDAKMIASRSTLTISIIIFFCLILGIVFTYLIFRDVRISDFYNLKLIGERNQAEQLVKSKQQFLATMSHEIRTPLNTIIGFTEQLSTTDLKPAQKKYLEAVQTSGQHLLHTVNDILDYSKMEAGELKIAADPFDLHQCLTEVVETLEIKAADAGLDLKLSLDPDTSISLIGDKFRLKQILINLVSNGIKFTDEGFVKVSGQYAVENDIAKVRISVKDTGIGIPEEKRKEIFSDFKQVDASGTRRYQGTGLGLAICKRLVEMQGGSITVKSDPSNGSEFLVKLKYPVNSTSNSNSNGSSNRELIENAALSSLAGLKFLVADDDQFNIQLIQTILNKWGVQGTYCSDGSQAMEQVKEQAFDLILTDINMPGAGGIELSKYVRSLPDLQQNKTPIVALTANVMEDDLAKFRKSGIDGFVLKPFKEQDLYQQILELVDGHQLSKGNNQPTQGIAEAQLKLDDFRKFSGDDDDALRPMLETFHQNLKQNMEELSQGAKSNDEHKVAEVAHKLVSSFGHVHAGNIVLKLRDLENVIKSNAFTGNMEQQVAEIIDLSAPILHQLEEEIAALP